MVTGPRMADEAVPALSGLLAALDRGSRGAVLTGSGDARAGYLRAVRDDESGELDDVSTVDSAGTALGSAALVLAIAEQVDGGQGDYGLGRSARRVVPRLTAD